MNIYDGFIQRGQYYYKVTDVRVKKPYTPKHCLQCGLEKMMQTRLTAQFCSKSCSQAGKFNTMWTITPKYVAQHQRVYVERGKAESCVWGCHHTHYEWANLTGNYDDIFDYASMCKSCHAAYDGARTKCEDFICERGHSFERDGYYSRVTPKGEARQCKQCGKDRAAKKRQDKK